MSTIAFIADTTANVSLDEAKEHSIELLPLQIIVDAARSHRDMFEIDTPKVLELARDHTLSTSLPLAGDLVKILDRLVEEGKREVLCFPLSQGISGSYGLYRQILPLYEDRLHFHLVDGRTATLGQRYPLIKASAMAREGHSFDEIVREVERLVAENLHLFSVENLDALHRNGRISRTVKLIGNLIEARPIIGFDPDGKLDVLQKVRGNKKAVFTLAKKLRDFAGGRKVESAAVVSAGDSSLAQYLVQTLREEHPELNIDLLTINSVLAVHTGETIVGAGIFLA